LEKALTQSPETFGLKRTRWDGVVMVEFLRQECNVELKPRQARNWLKRLGFVLKRPVYRYLQASNKGVARFRRGLKKNSTES
jgi:transposase